jgi:CDGSH-type Zn-finger protein
MRGELTVDGKSVGFRAALCRCGASKRKPFCDKSHKYVGFAATGEPPSRKSELEPLEQRDGVLAVEPELDGPLVMQGNIEIVAGSGRTVAITREERLCRCGASANKPFCDESHRVTGFRSI